ncbi:MAG: hypothetical protein IK092_04190, partial [Muribaculaceae bacterium]|nr:hypothetical protein [Muribaculaceae bacterium]
MRKNLLKRLALGALLAGALTSYAATLEKTDVEGWNWKVTIDDVVLVPGDSVEVPILVTNDHEFIGFQTDIVLTDGLELRPFVTWNEDDEEWNSTFFEKTARFKSTHVVESSHPFADHWRYIT